MDLLVYALVSGILYGVFFALVGLGLSLIFGVMRVVNVAHGDVIMWGAFSSFWLYTLWHIGPVLALPIIFISFFVFGCIVYYGIVPRILQAEDPELASLIVFFGVSQVLEAIATIAFGNTQRSLPDSLLGGNPVQLFGQSFPQSWFWTGLISAAVIVLVYLYLSHTRTGYATRAIMSSRQEAASVGVNVSALSALNFGIGIGLAAIPGCFVSFIAGNISPDIGLNLTVISFAVIVVGSLGKPLGAVLGGLVYGIATALMQTYLPSWATLLPNVLLILIMLVRPGGLLGSEVRRA